KIREAISSDEVRFNDEFRIQNADGSIRWIESKATISRDAKGKATRMYGVNIDITERKQTEEKIRLSENQLRLVTNAVPALISYVDSNECFRYVNQQFTEWFGTSTDELVGKKLRDVFGTQAYRIIKPQVDEALSGVNCTYETVLNFKGAGPRYVHISYMPDVGVDGTVYGYYGLTHDLTDLKRSQDLLRSSEERLAMMIESLTYYAIFFMNSDGLIDTWNRGAEIIFGYSQEEAIGHSYELLFTAEDIEKGVPGKELRNVMEKGRASEDLWYQRKDGTRFYANGVMMPLFVGKRLTGYAKIASDLTEKQRHADELQRAHDELGIRVKERTKELAQANLALLQEMEEREVAERQRIDLLGRLVTSQEFERRRIARDLHDQLGQRLTALRLKIASLRDAAGENVELVTRVERLQELAEQIDSEVSFLAWELRPSALDDLGLVEAVGAFVKEWSRHVEISAEFHSNGLFGSRLNHDTETHLYRITQEALNNITKHAGATHVTVMLERRDDNVILIVEDNGSGFDPSAVRVSSESGSGLGLVGMNERATLIDGSIEFESAIGRGTTIYVRIPVSLS
ncbi:MAG: PAS domain S-box protein, partial [Pyrinomonadaceae bacterium]